MSPAPVLVQATDTEQGCTVCRSQKTVTLHPQHCRRCDRCDRTPVELP